MLNKIVLILAMGFSYTALSFDDVPITPGTCKDRYVNPTTALIEKGRKLFKKEKFNGNGRTCQTCHRENHNFTIDAKFIATLPNNDPLFVAENNSDLFDLDDLENPVMMREFGLIRLNIDGFDKPGVLRGVPHLLGLGQTNGAVVNDSKFGTPVHETGWSADGAPDDRSLRCFPVGAIVQHFTKSMDRINEVDFRLPTEHELDALFVYQLSLGRQNTPVVSNLNFLEPAAQRGKEMFFGAIPTKNPNLGTKSCAECHVEGGAHNGANFMARNRIINSNLSPNAPICRGLALNPPLAIPGDGGFGKTSQFFDTIACGTGNIQTSLFSDQNQQSRGFFNTVSLLEAADTAPYFHDNSAETLEDAIRFYSSDPFNVSDGAIGRAFDFGLTGVNDLGAFLRAINALENARSAIDHVDKSLAVSGKNIDVDQLRLALADSKDGIKVLTTGPLPRLFPKAVNLFRDANLLLRVAIASRNRVFANLARSKLEAVSSKISS